MAMTEQEFMGLKPWFEETERKWPGIVDQFRKVGAEMGLSPQQAGEKMYYAFQGAQPADTGVQEAAQPVPMEPTPVKPTQAPSGTAGQPQESAFDSNKYEGLMQRLGPQKSGMDVLGGALARVGAGIGAAQSAAATGQNASTAAINAANAVIPDDSKQRAAALDMMFKMRDEERASAKEGREAAKFDTDTALAKDRADPNSEVSQKAAARMQQIMPNLNLTGMSYDELKEFAPDLMKKMGYDMQAEVLANTVRHQGVMEGQGAAAGRRADISEFNEQQRYEQTRRETRRKELEKIIDNSSPSSPEAISAKAELQNLSSGVENIYISPETGEEMPRGETLPGTTVSPSDRRAKAGTGGKYKFATVNADYAFDNLDDLKIAYRGIEGKEFNEEELPPGVAEETPPAGSPPPSPTSPAGASTLSPKDTRALNLEREKEKAKIDVEQRTELQTAREDVAPKLQEARDLLVKHKDDTVGITGPVTGRFPSFGADAQRLETIMADLQLAKLALLKGAPSDRDLAKVIEATVNALVDEDVNVTEIDGLLERIRNQETRLEGAPSTPPGSETTIKYGRDGRKYEVDPSTRKVLREIK